MDIAEDIFHLGVKALIHNDEGELLLLKRNPIRCGGQLDCWDIPGGRIQKKESLEEALKREVQEETGLQNMTQITPLLMTLSDRRISIQNGDVGLIFTVYLCSSDSFSICLSEEHIDFGWFKPAKAAELLAINHPKDLVDRLIQLKLAIKNSKK